MEGLGINLGYLLVQILNFAIIFLVITAWVVKPVVNMLKKRQTTIAEGLENAKKASEARANAQAEADKIIKEAQKKAAEIIREATERADGVVLELKAEAEHEISASRHAVLVEVKGERDRMLQEMRGQIAALAIAATQKLIGESLDEKRQLALVNEFFTGMKEGKVVVLGDKVFDGKTVEVTSALPLEEAEQESVKKSVLKSLKADKDAISFQFLVNPQILGGIIVRIGDQVIDGSVSGQLQELKASL